MHLQYKKIAKDAARLAATILPKTLAEKAYAQPLDLYDARLAIEEMNKRDVWGKKATAFAEVFAPYAKQLNNEQQEQQQNGQGNGQGKSGQQKQQSKPGEGNGSEKKSSPSKPKEEKHSHGRCGFVKEMMKDPEQRKDFVKRALAKGREAGPAGIPYVTQQESYEAAYEHAAEEIVLKFFQQSDDGDQPTFDLFYMQDRALENDEQITGKMHWSKTMFVPTPEGKQALLYRSQAPYQIEEELLPGNKALMDRLYVIDVSGSMDWNDVPLDGSKYDLALRSLFGDMKGLEHLGRAAHTKYGLVLFSNSTQFSGWEDYYSLDRFKKLAFTGYQGGGTVLDSTVMDRVLQQNNHRFLTVIISDGEIANDATSIVKKYLDAGNDVVQFAIGGATSFSAAIKKHGAQVVPVNTPGDLTGLVLENTLGRYR